MKLKKGDKIVVDCDYEWKYGEPSVYNDEQLWYLTFKVNGVLVDDENDEYRILKRTKTNYMDLLKAVKISGTQHFTI